MNDQLETTSSYTLGELVAAAHYLNIPFAKVLEYVQGQTVTHGDSTPPIEWREG